MLFDAIVTLGGLVLPPAFDFIKKKFLKPEEDTTEATMNALATTSPDTLPAYITALVEKVKADILFFNRDVIGTPRQWIIDLRAAIRPLTVAVAVFALVGYGEQIAPGTRLFFEGISASWYGSRLSR